MRMTLSRKRGRSALVSGIALLYLFIQLFQFAPAHAEAIPGGNVKDTVVRAVDLAKPAVVRIITGLNATLTVYFSTTKRVTFPRDGGNYQLQLSGSGTFISSHGDILTADHVINPPHGPEMDQALYQQAAQDVADYINQNLSPAVAWDATNAYAALAYGQLLSAPQYDQPQSKVYLSTDYAGPFTATSFDKLPAGVAIDVDKIENSSPTDQKDVAIIHIPRDDTPSVQLGDASSVAQQDELTIIGFPGNGDVTNNGDPTSFLTSSVNKIYVSALKKSDQGASLIQVGGNVENGDSGGPALNSAGQIVGIVSFGVGQPTTPQGTAFLQSGASAQELLNGLNLDTKPGKFERMWTQAYADYTATDAGHWHRAQQDFNALKTTYTDFQAVAPYVTYVNTQAAKEQDTTSGTNSMTLIGFGILAVAVVLAIVVISLLLLQRRRRGVTPAYAMPGMQAGPFAPPTFGTPPPATPQPQMGEGSYQNTANGGTGVVPVTPTPVHNLYEPPASPTWQSNPGIAQPAAHSQVTQPPITPWSPAPVQQQPPVPVQPTPPSWGPAPVQPTPPVWGPAPVQPAPEAVQQTPAAPWGPAVPQNGMGGRATPTGAVPPWPPAPSPAPTPQQPGPWSPSAPTYTPATPGGGETRNEEWGRFSPEEQSPAPGAAGNQQPAPSRPQETPQPPVADNEATVRVRFGEDDDDTLDGTTDKVRASKRAPEEAEAEKERTLIGKQDSPNHSDRPMPAISDKERTIIGTLNIPGQADK